MLRHGSSDALQARASRPCLRKISASPVNGEGSRARYPWDEEQGAALQMICHNFLCIWIEGVHFEPIQREGPKSITTFMARRNGEKLGGPLQTFRQVFPSTLALTSTSLLQWAIKEPNPQTSRLRSCQRSTRAQPVWSFRANMRR